MLAAYNGWAARQPLNAQGEQPTTPPELYLADTSPSLRELYEARELEWSEGEPAINVYTADGFFGTHKDHLALTLLMPLTAPSEFSGGGTGFWAGGRAVGRGEHRDRARRRAHAGAGHGPPLRR